MTGTRCTACLRCVIVLQRCIDREFLPMKKVSARFDPVIAVAIVLLSLLLLHPSPALLSHSKQHCSLSLQCHLSTWNCSQIFPRNASHRQRHRHHLRIVFINYFIHVKFIIRTTMVVVIMMMSDISPHGHDLPVLLVCSWICVYTCDATRISWLTCRLHGFSHPSFLSSFRLDLQLFLSRQQPHFFQSRAKSTVSQCCHPFHFAVTLGSPCFHWSPNFVVA